ncbi:MAG TPA: hypothetical protein VGJ03_17215 [Acidimicrobiales bacterium]|jgi:hypothetical protein
MRRTLAFRAGVAIAAGVLAQMLTMASAHASTATVLDVGWWTSQPGASAAPNGGFQVANGVNGPQSVAAVRLRKDGDPGPVTLVLTPQGGSVNEDAAAKLEACPIVADWTPANPGKTADAPKYDCSASVPVAKDAAGTWSADVTPLMASAADGQAVSLMVIPVGSQLFGGLQLPFQISFSGASVPGPAATPGVSSGASSSPSESPSFANGSSGVVAGSHPSVSGAPQPSAATGAPAAGTAAPPSTGAAKQTTAPPFIRISTGGGPGKPWGRLVYLVPLSAMGGLLVALARKGAAQRGLAGQPA